MKNNSNVYFLVATQTTNMGDLLINKLLVEEISKYRDVFLDLKGIPDSFKNHLQSNNTFSANELHNGSLKDFSFFRVLFTLKNKYSYFFKSPGPQGGISSITDFVNSIAFFIIYFFFNKSKVELNLVGNDVVVNTKLDLFLEKLNNSLFNSYLVRSKKNSSILSELGFRNIRYIPDMAFLLYDKIDHIQKEKKILISFRFIDDKQYLDNLKIMIRNIVDYYSLNNYEIHFMFQVESDKSFNYQLYSENKRDNCFFREECLWVDQLDYYNSFDIVFSNRLHVLLIGLLYHAIPFGILNNSLKTNKINRIFKDLELEHLLLDSSLTSIEEIQINIDNERDAVKKICNDTSKLCKQTIEKLFIHND